jgi:hypothetical protein
MHGLASGGGGGLVRRFAGLQADKGDAYDSTRAAPRRRDNSDDSPR